MNVAHPSRANNKDNEETMETWPLDRCAPNSSITDSVVVGHFDPDGVQPVVWLVH